MSVLPLMPVTGLTPRVVVEPDITARRLATRSSGTNGLVTKSSAPESRCSTCSLSESRTGRNTTSLRGRAYFLDVGLDRFRVVGLFGDQLAVVDDHREQVAELVGERPAGILGQPRVHSRFTSRHLLTSPSRS